MTLAALSASPLSPSVPGPSSLARVRRADDSRRAAAATASDAEQAVTLLAKPRTKRIPLANSGGRMILALGANGHGVLVLDGLGPAPAGKPIRRG